MQSLKRRIGRSLQNIFDLLITRSPVLQDLITQTVNRHMKTLGVDVNNPSISARYNPYLAGREHWHIPKQIDKIDISPDDGLPVPPQELWAGYGTTPAEYLSLGQLHFKRMMELLESSGYIPEIGHRIFEFGCAAGRMIRNFSGYGKEIEIWGSDISAAHIIWCHQHLSPPIQFLVNTTYPNLPFEQNYFHMVYAGSVFTHIGDLEDAWLMELRRILTKGGKAFITVHDNHTIKLLLDSKPGEWLFDTKIRKQLLEYNEEVHFIENGYNLLMLSRDPGNTQVFHDDEYIEKEWGSIFKVISIVPEAYTYQSAVILEK